MSTVSETIAFHRAAVAFHLAEISRLEGSPMPTDFDVNNPATWWPTMQREAAESMKPHAWREPGPGVPITMAGDNDKPDDDLLRAFRPFMDALTRATNPMQLDSAGERFYLPTIKRRAGTGWASWGVVRDEIRAKWYSPWGVAWRSDSANAHLVPKPEVVDALFSKVYE